MRLKALLTVTIMLLGTSLGCIAWETLTPAATLPPSASQLPQPTPTSIPELPPVVTLSPEGVLLELQSQVEAVYAAVGDSVVNIAVTSLAYDFFMNPVPQEGSGSGFIYDAEGHIVTNYHVVQDVTDIQVIFSDGNMLPATVVGSDPANDLAVLKVDPTAHSVKPMVLGRSDDLRVGQFVVAIGNPFGLEQTLTFGVISSLGRVIESPEYNRFIGEAIQTDAAINPGNSGGALVNINGELIGINAAIASNTGSYTGYSFAIPSNIVRKIISDILDFGDVQRAFLGVNFTDINSKLAAAHDIKDMKGVFVESVYEGGAADKAGIQKGDIIVKIDNSPITGSSELKEIIVRHRPGEKINVSVIRDNEIKQISLTLENSEGGTALLKSGEAGSGTVLGATLKEITDKEKIGLGLRSGVKIIKLEKGKLSGAGIREGLIITRIDNQQVKTTDDVVRLLGNKKGTVLIEGIYTNGMQAYFSFGL